jgi:NAD(P)-dependent dehydrogenase (short-subunit alcohol dehydrogenase family)
MDALKDRVCVITGAGRGIGREHAILFAAEGAKVVVNDLGGARDGSGADATPAEEVVAAITAAGGQAVANYDDVSTWDGASRLIGQAIETFGDLHVLVNNAGILRDRMVANMAEEEWDAVMRVHLKGHFAATHFAAAYWRDQSKAGVTIPRAVINTSSTSGLFGQVGQTNYGAAKSGIATFSIIANAELRRYGVRVNAVAPAAATRMTAGLGVEAGTEEKWSPGDPANISPFVAYLATQDCPIHGRVFFVMGGEVHLFQPWSIVDAVKKDGKWTVEELAKEAGKFADFPFNYGHPMASRVLPSLWTSSRRTRPSRKPSAGRSASGCKRTCRLGWPAMPTARPPASSTSGGGLSAGCSASAAGCIPPRPASTAAAGLTSARCSCLTRRCAASAWGCRLTTTAAAGWAARASWSGGRRSRSSGCCRRSSAARCAPGSCSPSRKRAPTSPARSSPPAATGTATC